MIPCNEVQVIRHTYDCFEVVAYDLWGRLLRQRMYGYGSKRKQWAYRQADEWSERFYLRIGYYECEGPA